MVHSPDPQRHRLLLIALLAGLILGGRALELASAPSLTASTDEQSVEAATRHNLATLVESRYGLRVTDPDKDVHWVSPPDAFGFSDAFRSQTFAFLARSGGQPRELYRIETRVGPGGRVYSPGWLVNLSHSAAADDAILVGHGSRIATAVSWENRILAIELRDFAGEDPNVTGVADWSWAQRQGDRITNLERTGQARGIALRHFTLTKPAPTVTLSLDASTLSIRAESTSATIALQTHETAGDLALQALAPEQKMPMQLLNWVADRGRGFADAGLAPAWLGTGVELMKEVYFTAGEVKADVEAIAEEPPEVILEPEEVVKVEEAVEEALELARLQTRQSNFPWPPPPLEPMLPDRVPGEGIWAEFDAEQVAPTPNGPPVFFHTFLRPSSRYRKRAVRIIAWDPRHLRLEMRAGTREPIPQTPHKGDGRIARDPALLSRVVAGFNGGFQTTHTTFGMMVERQLLLYPRRYGATVGLLEDGRPMFGTWDNGKEIPEDLVSFRQNLQPLVEDRVFNAYHRKRFGAHQNVAGAKDGWTCRSALCYTPQGVLMYFYAEYANEKTLAETILRAGCQYAIHLDMNWGHTGFELYRQLAADEAMPEDPKAAREVAGLRIKGSTPARRIRHMNKPTRYLGVDYRDFFYLVRQPNIPGANLPNANHPTGDGSTGEGRWLVNDLPHNAEYPPRLAWTWRRTAAGGRMEILQMDTAAASFGWWEEGAPLERDTLMAGLPAAAFEAPGSEHITVGNVQLHGEPLGEDPSTHPRVAVAAVDPAGHLWFIRASQVQLHELRDVLASRGIQRAVWRATPEHPSVWLYQSATTADGRPGLVELLPGDEQGVVVERPSGPERRLLVHRHARPERVVRRWPKANPWTYGDRGKKKGKKSRKNR